MGRRGFSYQVHLIHMAVLLSFSNNCLCVRALKPSMLLVLFEGVGQCSLLLNSTVEVSQLAQARAGIRTTSSSFVDGSNGTYTQGIKEANYGQTFSHSHQPQQDKKIHTITVTHLMPSITSSRRGSEGRRSNIASAWVGGCLLGMRQSQGSSSVQ